MDSRLNAGLNLTTPPDPTAQDTLDLDTIVTGLRAVRDQWRKSHQRELDHGGREFPSREAVQEIVEHLCAALFPMRLGPADLQHEAEDYFVGHTLNLALRALRIQVGLELRYSARLSGVSNNELELRAQNIVGAFASHLPSLRALLDTDVEAAFKGDPAARSVDEVVLCYPGLLAIIHHRLAHTLYSLDLPLIARIVAEIAHSTTGIDIHPGADIGESFFIDHGTGVVVGETAVIGKRVRLYQAVTLGAKRFTVGDNGELTKGQARHPHVEDDVVIYAGATILGLITIGKGSVIGGNVWLTHSVPAGSNVTQARSLQEVSSSPTINKQA